VIEEIGGVAELCVTVGRLRSDGMDGLLPKEVIYDAAKKMACYPCWALVPLLDLSRSRTRRTRQLVRGTDICLANGLRSRRLTNKFSLAHRTDGKSEIILKGRSTPNPHKIYRSDLTQWPLSFQPEQQPDCSPMCHYHPRFT
jgi:hypothetical protein